MTATNDRAYWVVACSSAEQARESIYAILKSRVVNSGLCNDSSVFDIPVNLKFGSFDELIRLMDDMGKYDSQTEGILRRMERQALDIDPAADFKIIWQRNSMTVDQYIRRFAWDDAKYPRTRTLRDNIELLVQSVKKLDDELRGKTAAYNDIKQSHSTVTKGAVMTFVQRDLTDVLTPDVVAPTDFVCTEHLISVVVVVPKSQAEVWQKSYESLCDKVVPRSARKFDVTDKEQNELWTVIIFKSALEDFKTIAKSHKFTVRDFFYSKDSYDVKQAERSRLEAEKNRQETFLSRVCFAAYSDAFIAWVHLKAMRVFVEAVLRFGVPPNFCAFFLKPAGSAKELKLRKELNDVFTTKGMFGKSYVDGAGPRAQEPSGAAGADIWDEEYFPYVSLELNPFGATTSS